MRALMFLILALVLPVPAFAGPAAGAPQDGPLERRVVEIHLNDAPHTGEVIVSIEQVQAAYFRNKVCAFYAIEVLPGLEYSIGLGYPSSNRDVRISMFDRLPYLPGAKRVSLPAGPVVRTNSQKVEYRWRTGISKKSTSSLLFIAVEMKATDRLISPLPHTVSVMTPPESPIDMVGSGITFLEGPREFILRAGPYADVSYVVEKTRPATASFLLTLPIIGDLLKNGWFRDGLNGWQTHRNYEVTGDVDSVSLSDEGLRMVSSSTSGKEGVMQRIDADVSDAESLMLRADVKVEKQAIGGTGPDGNTAPMAIALCYEDAEGREHCKDDMLWTGFYSIPPVEPNKSVNGQKVPKGLWYRYITDIMQLEPRPRFIKYISLEGAGTPEREAWIRDVHLVKRWKNGAGR